MDSLNISDHFNICVLSIFLNENEKGNLPFAIGKVNQNIISDHYSMCLLIQSENEREVFIGYFHDIWSLYYVHVTILISE